MVRGRGRAGEVGRCGAAAAGPEGRSVGPHDHRLHLLRRSPVFHQEVDHALGLDEEVAAEEEDAEDHGEREHAHDGDLHHAHDVQAALVGAALGEAVVGHHGRLGAAAHRALQRLAAVGQEQAGHIRLVAQRGIHRRGGRAPGRRGSEGWGRRRRERNRCGAEHALADLRALELLALSSPSPGPVRVSQEPF